VIYFDLVGLLRSGGNADLWLARLRATGETIVVKYLRDFQNASARRWFAREIRIVSKNFAGTVRFIGRDPRPEPLFYLMSCLPEGSATRWIGALSDDQLAFLAIELAQALKRLHAAGIAHGDIKPANILLGAKHWHLADPLGNGWGCTMILSQNCGGTPGYWAPEVKAGRPISVAADAYSYGATLFNIGTGVQPRDGHRLDLQVGYYRLPRHIREVIVHACNPASHRRPSMGDVLRILRGATMAQIRRERELQAWGVLGISAFATAVALARKK
jgi:serine/threonine protein kinase